MNLGAFLVLLKYFAGYYCLEQFAPEMDQTRLMFCLWMIFHDCPVATVSVTDQVFKFEFCCEELLHVLSATAIHLIIQVQGVGTAGSTTESKGIIRAFGIFNYPGFLPL